MAIPFESYAGKIPTTSTSDYVDKISQAFTNLDTDMGDIETRLSTNASAISTLETNNTGTSSGSNTGDMEDSEVKTAYENNADTNAYDNAAAAIVAAVANTTGTNTGDQDKTDIDALGINADQVDGIEAAAMAKLATDNSYTGRQNFTDFSEKANSIGTTGSITIDTSTGTYFYNTATTGAITFTFSNPASTGRVTTFTLELFGGGTNTPVFPGTVEWSGNVTPAWSTGKDIVSFSTRDGGTTWLGFLAGRDMS